MTDIPPPPSKIPVLIIIGVAVAGALAGPRRGPLFAINSLLIGAACND